MEYKELTTTNKSHNDTKIPDDDMIQINELLCKFATQGKIDDILALLNIGADVNYINKKKEAPLVESAFAGHIHIVDLLLKKGADIHIGEDAALRCAIIKGHTDIVKLLLKNGADIHVHNGKPLKLAIKHEHTQIIKLLVETINNKPEKSCKSHCTIL